MLVVIKIVLGVNTKIKYLLIKKIKMFIKLSSFYCLLFIPFLLIVTLNYLHLVSSNFFVYSLLVYALIYHPLISGIRLINCNKINKNQFWLNFIPFWNIRYYGFLYFNTEN